jgi:hypothetical protein
MEEDKNKKLNEIQVTLDNIYKVLKPTRYQMFIQGFWRAVGYLVGLMLAIVVIGWILNLLGFVPFLGNISDTLKEILNAVKTR